MPNVFRGRALAAAALAVVIVAGAGVLLWRRPAPRPPAPAAGMVYDPSGYGGYVGKTAGGSRQPVVGSGQSTAGSTATLAAATAAYNAGKYAEAEKLAAEVGSGQSAVGSRQEHPRLEPNAHGPQLNTQRPNDPTTQTSALVLSAYSAARRHDFAIARTRFAEAETAATGGDQSKIQNPKSKIAAEASYQHAVCTAALGDKPAAEKEYLAFLHRYPDSDFTRSAYLRIEKLHGGQNMAEADAAWKESRQIARARDKERRRQEALCGPMVLAELLRRKSAGGSRQSAVGRSTTQPPNDPTTQSLAKELQTDENGTTIAALSDACARHGMKAQALQLTEKGLEKQAPPMIALLQPGHYVLVEAVTPAAVKVWDPSLGRKSYPRADWSKAWLGVAVVVR